MNKATDFFNKPSALMIIIILIVFGGPLSVIGIGLLFWYIMSRKKQQKETQAAEAQRVAAIEKALDERVWTCKRCGANTKGRICEYCDSPYEQ